MNITCKSGTLFLKGEPDLHFPPALHHLLARSQGGGADLWSRDEKVLCHPRYHCHHHHHRRPRHHHHHQRRRINHHLSRLVRFLRGEYDRLGPFSWKEFATAFYFVSLVTLWFFQVGFAFCVQRSLHIFVSWPPLFVCILNFNFSILGASVHDRLGGILWQ